jgi:hypothetical protein
VDNESFVTTLFIFPCSFIPPFILSHSFTLLRAFARAHSVLVSSRVCPLSHCYPYN